MPKMQPAITDLAFTIPAGGGTSVSSRSYIDTAKQLSKINRRLYSQSRMYSYQGLTFIWRQDASNPLATIELSVRTAGNSWSVQNGHTKGKALWHQMQDLVLEDNPSIAGKWHDFKVRLCANALASKHLEVRDGQGNAILGGEWAISKYVLPQHDVDPATGLPLVADEVTACLIGASTPTIKSLVESYELSRSTVQPEDPSVPAGLVDSFFNLLTDSGSQEPELATVILGENDEPPYDQASYVGGSLNGVEPLTVQYGAISASEVDGKLGGFIAPCGLLELEIKGYDATGAAVEVANLPAIDILLHVMPGTYKGVGSIPMGQ